MPAPPSSVPVSAADEPSSPAAAEQVLDVAADVVALAARAVVGDAVGVEATRRVRASSRRCRWPAPPWKRSAPAPVEAVVAVVAAQQFAAAPPVRRSAAGAAGDVLDVGADVVALAGRAVARAAVERDGHRARAAG